VEGKPAAAEYDRVPAIPNRISVDIALVEWIRRKRLSRHSNQLDPLGKNKLWIEVEMGFDKPAAPCESHGPVREQ
jgi:hypothetical protein